MPQSVEQLNEQNEKKRAELALMYKKVFNSDAGKVVLDDLMKHCRFKYPLIDPNTFDTNRTFFNEGARNVFIFIMSNIEREVK